MVKITPPGLFSGDQMVILQVWENEILYAEYRMCFFSF